MKKKTLNEKIGSAMFWLLMFFISYFIIGFVLKVDLSKQFDAIAFYDVLRDALTLTAYFLAPVAALILFSDWREQHHSVSNFELSKKTNAKLKRSVDQIEIDHRFFLNYSEEQFKTFMSLIFDLAVDMDQGINGVYIVDNRSKLYVQNLRLANSYLAQIFTSLQQSILYNEEYKDKDNYQNKLNELFEDRQKLITNIRDLNFENLKI